MDAREELRRRLDAGEISAEVARRTLATMDIDADQAALRAAERWGNLTREESLDIIEELGVSEEAIQAVAERYGVQLDAA